MQKTAVVTGASSGIGAATARALHREGFSLILVARRADRLQTLADELGAVSFAADVRSQSSVEQLAETINNCDLLVNCAGGAVGMERVVDAVPQDWLTMYDTNVLGTLRVTQALLPALRRNKGTIITVTSTAALWGYEGGGGYCAAKSGERAMVQSLRLELCGEPIRVVEILPGMVKTDEFALVRFRNDREKAAQVYEGIDMPLSAEDIAHCIAFAATVPPHVNIDELVVRPVAQAAQYKVHRKTPGERVVPQPTPRWL